MNEGDSVDVLTIISTNQKYIRLRLESNETETQP